MYPQKAVINKYTRTSDYCNRTYLWITIRRYYCFKWIITINSRIISSYIFNHEPFSVWAQSTTTVLLTVQSNWIFEPSLSWFISAFKTCISDNKALKLYNKSLDTSDAFWPGSICLIQFQKLIWLFIYWYNNYNN